MIFLPLLLVPIIRDLFPSHFGDFFHLALIKLYKANIVLQRKITNKAPIKKNFTCFSSSLFLKKNWHDEIIDSLETKSQQLLDVEAELDQLITELEQS